MIKIDSVRGLVLLTPKFAECDQFYGGTWGLQRLPAGAEGASYFAGSGAEPWILGLKAADAAALESVRLGVRSTAEVAAAHSTLANLGVEMDGAPRELPEPGGYFGFRFKDPDGRWTEISALRAPSTNVDGAARAQRISHIVINSTDARRLADFYVKVLGFAISDWYERDYLIFLRCGEDHHSLGFAQASRCALNHVAFLVNDLEEMMRASGSVKKAGGGDPIWGPGRHGPGGNVFAYFEDPAGFVTEYTAELIQIKHPETWSAKEWRRIPENANVWGTGGPTPRAIALMDGGAQADIRTLSK